MIGFPNARYTPYKTCRPEYPIPLSCLLNRAPCIRSTANAFQEKIKEKTEKKPKKLLYHTISAKKEEKPESSSRHLG
jgi:hypothetical protein